MIKTVVFGGTFDPPHAGHKNLLENVMKRGYDKAIVIPAKIPPHKTRDNQTDDFGERFEKTKQMFSDFENVTVSDIENKRDGKSYTWDTLCMLKTLYPDEQFYLLIGSDMLLYMEKWYNFKQLLATTPIISAARSKDDYQKILTYKKYLEKNYKCDIIIYDIDILELSSTELRDPIIKKIDAHNKAHLSKSRYDHVISVANYAAYLAPRFDVSAKLAYIAGLAHDCTKFMDTDSQLEYFKKHGIKLTNDELACPKIYHQISGAHFAKHFLGITDNDILNSIRYHTTGREGMSTLEKLICLADSIEPLRDYDGVDKMRKTAKTDLDGALLMSLDRLIDFVKQRGLVLNEQTVKARDYERKRYGTGITNC